MILAVLVSLGASFGAVSRYLIDQAVTRSRASAFPAGTWVINITGSFILGLFTGLAAHHGLPVDVVTVVGTGVCGGYTTFSTFSYETLRLTEDGSGLLGLGNIAASLTAGLAAAALGLGAALL
ncbi:fluoride efflux transporter CrcB [Actinospica robiniae]|uniref:fluoride efflux transporter CrcB n=1 Tax=Actinospica robiniae TaxID=304901 RepID=UPI000408A197|nr:fluoride efflux transporter CrcB [Actinospica robiniae]